MFKDFSQNLFERFDDAVKHLNERVLERYPEHLRHLIILDRAFAAISGAGKQAGTISFAEALDQLRGHKVVSVLGGSRLGIPGSDLEAVFAPFNRILATELYQYGWSVASGGGPGEAMKAPQACLRSNRNDVYPRNCKNVVVASDLNDEKLHNHADLIVRSPGGHIATREQMILGLSQVALFYPGHLGTLAEFFDTALQNYCEGRGRFHYSPPIAIFVSPRYYNEQTKSDSEEHFYTGALDQFLESSPKFALSKGESYDWLKVIITPSPQRMKSLTPDERESILKPLVGKILNHMETHIANKFGDTLNAGYGNGFDLRQHYICSYAQGI